MVLSLSLFVRTPRAVMVVADNIILSHGPALVC